MTKSAAAAAVIRRSITCHGFRTSESEIRQRSCPSGAPMRAAAAVAAVTPGTTVTATPAHRPDAFSLWSSSTTALAMAKMPGSPDETMTTSRPAAARSRAKAARAASLRLGNECDVWCSAIGPDLAQIRTVADQVGGFGQAGGGFGRAPRRHLPARVRPRPDDPCRRSLIGSAPSCSVSPPWKSTVRSPGRPGPTA